MILFSNETYKKSAGEHGYEGFEIRATVMP
jgi:hypothetical protein